MATDLILRAPTRAQMGRFLTDDLFGGKALARIVEGEPVYRQFITACEYGGSGKFMTAPAVIDNDGNVTTEGQFAPGYFLLMRVGLPDDAISDDNDDEPDGTDPAREKPWNRSRVARILKKAAQDQGAQAGIPYFEYTGDNGGAYKARIYDGQAAIQWQKDNGAVPHEWAGGNTL